MRLSLICGTAGRTAELERALLSISLQTAASWELLVVDQNGDDRAARIIGSLKDNSHVQRLVTRPGLIRALNLGLKNSTGDILGFPDDDCWYPPSLLASLESLLAQNADWDGITVPTKDDQGRPSISRWHTVSGRLTKNNVGFRGCSTSMFFRRRVYEKIGGFDENIGGGLLSPSADMDYIHRAVQAGFHIEYRPELFIGHPQTLSPTGLDEKSRRKRYSYGFGEGSIARKFTLPLWYSFGLVAAPFARSCVRFISGKTEQARLEWLTFRGRLDGYVRHKSG